RSERQEATSDAAIAAAIRKGHGPMPPFDLPPPMVAGLVAHVRSLGPVRTP
ncbi:MAG: hypothetical protein JRI23_07925, partial [Deltaproteobacteria bacterium]|nr:hypothetical protein [Deltaproteobacteria bacterium]MBW2531534.1 hypothetical protein [Deltaproteobacteria bacterium]